MKHPHVSFLFPAGQLIKRSGGVEPHSLLRGQVTPVQSAIKRLQVIEQLHGTQDLTQSHTSLGAPHTDAILIDTNSLWLTVSGVQGNQNGHLCKYIEMNG